MRRAVTPDGVDKIMGRVTNSGDGLQPPQNPVLRPSDQNGTERRRIECEIEDLEVQAFKALADSCRLLEHVERVSRQLDDVRRDPWPAARVAAQERRRPGAPPDGSHTLRITLGFPGTGNGDRRDR
jgi:hypothetical protein